MLKKSVYIIFTIVVLCCSSINVKAEPSGSISLTGPTSAKSEEEVTVKVNLTTADLEESKGVDEISLKIPYDKESLTYLSSEKPLNFTMTPTATEGLIEITLNYTGDTDPENPNPFTNGNILTLNFKTRNLSEDKEITITPEVNAKFDTTDVSILTATYKLSISKKEQVIVEPEKSNNNSLKSLTVLGYSLNKQFTKEITNYTLTVASDITELTIQATVEDPKSTVVTTGNKSFKTGTNTVLITVTAENGSKKVYQITVTKTPSDNNYLRTLYIEGIAFKETFNKYTLKYTAIVEPNQEKVTVIALAENQKANVEIKNIDELEVGKNIITIFVTAENKEVQEYTIEVTRKGEETLTAPTPTNTINLQPAKKESKTFPIALGTTGGVTLGLTWAIFIIQKKKRIL